MVDIVRAQHWTDLLVAGPQRMRKHRNWANWQSPAGIWSPSDEAMESAVDPGDLEGGSFVYGEAQTRAPLQVYLKNSDDAENSTRVHVRKASHPRQWFEVAANKGDPNFNLGVPADVTRADRKIVFADLWQTGAATPRKANLIWLTQRHRLDKRIRIKGPNAPTSYQFRFRLPLGWSLVVRPNGSIAIRNPSNDPRFIVRSPIAWDSADGGNLRQPGPLSGSYNAAYTIDSQTTAPGGNPVYIVSVALTDSIASAVFPVFLDPTSTVSGTADIEDNMMISTVSNSNYGGFSYMLTGRLTSEHYRYVIRISDISAIPAGTLDAARMLCYHQAYANSTQQNVVNAYPIVDANAWVEGTNSGGPSQIGSSNWNYAVHSSLAWAGSGGCSTSGTDWDAASAGNFTLPAYTSGPDVQRTLTFDSTTIFAQWRDSIRVSNGFFMWGQVDINNRISRIMATEDANAPTFEIDYTEPSGLSRGIGRSTGRSTNRAAR